MLEILHSTAVVKMQLAIVPFDDYLLLFLYSLSIVRAFNSNCPKLVDINYILVIPVFILFSCSSCTWKLAAFVICIILGFYRKLNFSTVSINLGILDSVYQPQLSLGAIALYHF
jgi:hypothetical protein